MWGLPVGLAALLVSVLALHKPEKGNTAALSREWAATLAVQIAAGGRRCGREQRPWMRYRR
ncbi:hypothetical protein [Streptomyces sp. NPDC002685]|uniref:hypothetical protein n=1 Tax=Streptomyces sp. NPDC002685 TaxID=3154540 RepID=UPI003320D4F1